RRRETACRIPSVSMPPEEPGVRGRCPCCGADLLVEARRRFGIMACPECARVIWWLIPSDRAVPPFLPTDPKHGEAELLGAVELVRAWEEELGMESPDEDAKKLTSVEDILEYVKKRSKK